MGRCFVQRCQSSVQSGQKGSGKHEYCKGNHHAGPFAKIQKQCVSTLRGPSEVSKWMSLMVE